MEIAFVVNDDGKGGIKVMTMEDQACPDLVQAKKLVIHPTQ